MKIWWLAENNGVWFRVLVFTSLHRTHHSICHSLQLYFLSITSAWEFVVITKCIIFAGKKINEQRAAALKMISDLKQELRELEASFTEKNQKYKSIKAYSKVSAIEVEICNIFSCPDPVLLLSVENLFTWYWVLISVSFLRWLVKTFKSIILVYPVTMCR